MTTKLSPHFTLAEATITQTGLNNSPTAEQLKVLELTATNMEIVRAVLDRNPIIVSSWFRSQAVNKAVGGVTNSEHALGRAVDFKCPAFGNILKVCQTLVVYAHIINYNQLILEPSWVHISFPPDGVRGKREVLTLKSGTYYQGLR